MPIFSEFCRKLAKKQYVCYNNYMKTKRAFTLLELVVVLAVTAIALSLVSVVCAQANAFFVTKKLGVARQAELTEFQSTFSNCLEQYQTAEYSLIVSQPKNFITFNSPYGQSIIKFEDMSLWNNQEIIKTFKQIENVTLTATSNFIQCTLVFDEQVSHTLVFNKRS